MKSRKTKGLTQEMNKTVDETVEQIIILINKLDNENRLKVFSRYCLNCGRLCAPKRMCICYDN